MRSGRIVGGHDAYDGEFPWIVSVHADFLERVGRNAFEGNEVRISNNCVISLVQSARGVVLIYCIVIVV